MWVRYALLLLVPGCAGILGIDDTVNGHVDADHDGIVDTDDNCIGITNPQQEDRDNDGIGDPCDVVRQFDFDGDGKADPAVLRHNDPNRPGGPMWYWKNPPPANFTAVPWGLDTDLLVPADYDADGLFDVAVTRVDDMDPNRSYLWFILDRRTQNFLQPIERFGGGKDIPIGADLDGDLKSDFIVYRIGVDGLPDNGIFLFQTTTQPENLVQGYPFGVRGDIPFVANWDADGIPDFLVYRPSVQNWYYASWSTMTNGVVHFDVPADSVPILADFDGDHRIDPGVYTPSTGKWTWQSSSHLELVTLQFGSPGDIAVPADYDGDGKDDPAVFHVKDDGKGYFLINPDTEIQFGSPGDIPLEGRQYMQP